MKKIFTAIILIFVGSDFLFAQKKTEKKKICISEVEFAVYKAIGVGNFQNGTSRYSSSDFDYMKTKFPDMSPETVADYQAKNDKDQPSVLQVPVFRESDSTMRKRNRWFIRGLSPPEITAATILFC